jgi:hypothetical protein
MLHLPRDLNPSDGYDGPVWQEMLECNNSLKELSFQDIFLKPEAFQQLAHGLSRNSSLEVLKI